MRREAAFRRLKRTTSQTICFVYARVSNVRVKIFLAKVRRSVMVGSCGWFALEHRRLCVKSRECRLFYNIFVLVLSTDAETTRRAHVNFVQETRSLGY
jgi:hypothetical protein